MWFQDGYGGYVNSRTAIEILSIGSDRGYIVRMYLMEGYIDIKAYESEKEAFGFIAAIVSSGRMNGAWIKSVNGGYVNVLYATHIRAELSASKYIVRAYFAENTFADISVFDDKLAAEKAIRDVINQIEANK